MLIAFHETVPVTKILLKAHGKLWPNTSMIYYDLEGCTCMGLRLSEHLQLRNPSGTDSYCYFMLIGLTHFTIVFLEILY